MKWLRRLFLDIAISFLEQEVRDVPNQLAKDQEDILLASLWENPAFRKRIAQRDTKLIYTMAGGEGMQPEPREAYWLHAGQRVENLLLARDTKAAWARIDKQRKGQALTTEQDKHS